MLQRCARSGKSVINKASAIGNIRSNSLKFALINMMRLPWGEKVKTCYIGEEGSPEHGEAKRAKHRRGCFAVPEG
jgi:hypothetical protein